MNTRVASLLFAALLWGCSTRSGPSVRTQANEAYLRGSADAAKQLYWAKQALEAPDHEKPAGEIRYYTWEQSGWSRDGRRLAPESVGVPVFIPSPAPAASDHP